ncbi:unnamed protein product [Linum tenue]|uniref:Uncharacterized protein n=1 Tax=Linum tenue TaxID=586396 RepID=A0AAV0MJK9_9ROSI|nr:unnamed protein product [Linum tenue]
MFPVRKSILGNLRFSIAFSGVYKFSGKSSFKGCGSLGWNRVEVIRIDWAEVSYADAFSGFEDVGLDDKLLWKWVTMEFFSQISRPPTILLD